MGFGKFRSDYVIQAMEKGIPFALGFDSGEWEGSEGGHIYRDAVIIHGPYSTWLYHGNPIAQLNRTTGLWKASTCGWEDSMTTRARLNTIPGVSIYTHKGKRYASAPWGKTAKEIREMPEWEDDRTMVLPHPTYVRYDAWRGHSVPLTVVCGASNTGGWDDSPCRPEDEIKAFQAHLSANGIRSTVCWTRTSNVFCIKNWVQVHPKHLEKARELWTAYEAASDLHLLHSA